MDLKILIPTAVGAFIGSLLTLIATLIAHYLQNKQQKKYEESVLHGFIQGVHDELETLWEIYDDGMGNKIEALNEGVGLNVYYPVTQEYFTFYTTNAALVGKIRDHDLRKSIVSVYTKAKGLIDSYKMNNEILSKLEQAHWIYQATKSPADEASFNAYKSRLINYAKKLKKRHNDVKQHTQSLLRDLRKQGVLNKSL